MLKVVTSCINTQLGTSNHVEVYLMYHSDFDGCNCVADVVLQFLYRVRILFVYRTFLLGHLKSTVCESNPHTIPELNDNISHVVAAIKITMLHRVYLNTVIARMLTNCSDTLRNTHTKVRENITSNHAKLMTRYFFVAHSVYIYIYIYIPKDKLGR